MEQLWIAVGTCLSSDRHLAIDGLATRSVVAAVQHTLQHQVLILLEHKEDDATVGSRSTSKGNKGYFFRSVAETIFS